MEFLRNYKVIREEVDMSSTVGYFENLASFVKESRGIIKDEDTHLNNIIDEACTLIYLTLYKLKFLK